MSLYPEFAPNRSTPEYYGDLAAKMDRRRPKSANAPASSVPSEPLPGLVVTDSADAPGPESVLSDAQPAWREGTASGVGPSKSPAGASLLRTYRARVRPLNTEHLGTR